MPMEIESPLSSSWAVVPCGLNKFGLRTAILDFFKITIGQPILKTISYDQKAEKYPLSDPNFVILYVS